MSAFFRILIGSAFFMMLSVSQPAWSGGSTPPIPAPEPTPTPEPLPEPDPNKPSVIGFSLYDEITGADVVYKDIQNGDTLDLELLPSSAQLNIRAKVNDLAVSVAFGFDDQPRRVENAAPYTVFLEDGSGEVSLSNGNHTFYAEAYSDKNAGGVKGERYSISVRIVGAGSANPNPTPGPEPGPTPELPPSDYDPRKDPAYNGFKYRPGQGYSGGKWKLPAPPSCVKDVTRTITVNGTFDGKGCLYRWRGNWNGKSYKQLCFAPKELSEGTPAMFDLRPGATLKNVVIECALDGIHTSRDNVIDNVFMRDVEEDAVTARENVTIKNSQFWYCNDKCIQMNSANGVKIFNNKFINAQTPILANWGRNVEVKNNYLYNTNRGIRARSDKSNIIAEGNDHEIGGCHYGAEDKGLIENWGTGRLSSVKKLKCEDRGGRVVNK